MSSSKITAVIFDNQPIAPGEQKTVYVDAPEGNYTPLRMLVLPATSKLLKIVNLKVSDREILGPVVIADTNVDSVIPLQGSGSVGKFSLVKGCVFELTLKNESSQEAPVLIGISGVELVD